MSAFSIELILARQFADSLFMAAFLVDPKGNLLFYNEGAEKILGQRFSETGSMALEEWSTVFKPKDVEGNLLPPEALPLVQTLMERTNASGPIYIDGMDGEKRLINIVSFPIENRAKDFLGAMALFYTSA